MTIAATTPRRPRILLIALSWVRSDPRVQRQLQALLPVAEVVVCGFGDGDQPGARLAPIDPRGRTLLTKVAHVGALLMRCHPLVHRTLPHLRAARGALAGLAADAVIVNDVELLPLMAGRPWAVIFDAHEFAPGEWEDLWWWRWLYAPMRRWLCRRWLPTVDAMTTVSPGLAALYRDGYGVEATVVSNACAHQELQPTAADGTAIRLVHQGAAIRSRHIELLLETMALLDARFTLTLMLVERDPGYLAWLRQRGAGDARIRFVAPVPMAEVPQHLNAHDLGVFLLPPVNRNYLHALPNKLFEFVQARLGVAIGPSPDMAALVRGHGLGVVADDFTPAAFARALSALDAQRIAGFKQASHRAARELSAEHTLPTIRAVLDAAHQRAARRAGSA
jgi:hypothetical protein